jgi:FkbM family methyltransferase
MLFASIVGKEGKVYSIEPTDNQFPYLVKNIELNGFKDIVEPIHAGAHDKNEDFDGKVNNFHKGKIKGVKLDDIIKEPVDFIKIDVDGNEPNVLKGMEEMIKRSPNMKMIIEWYPEYMKNLGNDPQGLMSFLQKYFDVARIAGDYEGDDHCNYYCTRKL